MTVEVSKSVKVPEHIKLDPNDEGWTWWVKNNILHYCDKTKNVPMLQWEISENESEEWDGDYCNPDVKTEETKYEDTDDEDTEEEIDNNKIVNTIVKLNINDKLKLFDQLSQINDFNEWVEHQVEVKLEMEADIIRGK